MDDIEREGPDISREFLAATAKGEAPFCAHPWDSLRMKNDGHTRVCCDMISLPKLGFPTAREFHSATGMWNHPFLQHLRRTMGTGNETAFCKVCLTTNKRDPKNLSRRLAARTATKAQFLKISTSFAVSLGRGSLKNYKKKLPEFSFKIGPGQRLRPFHKDADFYRLTLQRIGFGNRSNVLMYGCRELAFTPFLAEISENLTIVDASRELVSHAQQLCDAFDLSTQSHVEQEASLPFPSGAFDGVWISGRSLAQAHPAILQELGRCLSPQGTLHVRGAPAAGRLVQKLARERAPKRRNEMTALLAAEGLGSQTLKLFSRADLRQTLRHHGLKLDVNMPLKAVPAKLTAEEHALLAAATGRQRSDDAPVDLCLNFSARLLSGAVDRASLPKHG